MREFAKLCGLNGLIAFFPSSLRLSIRWFDYLCDLFPCVLKAPFSFRCLYVFVYSQFSPYGGRADNSIVLFVWKC